LPQDNAQTAIWFRKAADQGYADAQFGLGVMYAEGAEGVPQDYAQAAVWLHKAADQGDARAQIQLGSLYAQAHGVPQDYVQATVWFNLALRSLDAAIRDLAVKIRDAVAAEMTPDQIAEAQRLASEWVPKK
jgi:uncharacterized protein